MTNSKSVILEPKRKQDEHTIEEPVRMHLGGPLGPQIKGSQVFIRESLTNNKNKLENHQDLLPRVLEVDPGPPPKKTHSN